MKAWVTGTWVLLRVKQHLGNVLSPLPGSSDCDNGHDHSDSEE